MKKILLSFLLILALAVPSFSATWFGCADQEITAAATFKDDAACTGSALTWASLANGDLLVANGHTISIANDVGSGAVQVTLTTEGTDYGGADGGGYTFDINAVAAKTLYTHLVASTTDCLTISGTGSSGTELTINGNITGGGAAGAEGANDSHSGSGANIVVVGNITGGSNGTAYGYTFSSPSGSVLLTGNATGSVATAFRTAGAAGATITGNCTAYASDSVPGCHGSGAGAITIIGNIVNTARGVGARGSIIWNPTAPASGVTGHYIKFDGGGTAVYAGKNTDDVAKALTTFYYIDPTDGGSDQGSATTGGAGAWGF